MTTVNSVLDIQSSHTELGKQIVSSVVAKLNEGNIADAVHHFGANSSSATTHWDSSSTTRHG